ncbi:AmpG family muropeptide MFS transporter [Aquisalimonas asiatica]|uniref:MFS transporter, PAT family, beta-lactamase induction signal transducer AmpG n=1 Tax=Aquisalimonas asiatica TaxID=406100 RepID=A0A1H8VFL6_9GAMM|nr:AmpG family muropeptide MFS transporter [Aquisalimonas asiatica]SEP13997.1 MFS transporter, PAT family, beta-lactamase induction signal transducer AmpG [Aquisalimonas asiatica]
MSGSVSNTASPSRLDALRVYAHPRVFAMLFLGFAAGLPLLLVGGTFTAWLRDLGVELAAIGFLSWVGLAHSIKVLWAPLVDRLTLPVLTPLFGRRRAWILTAQCTVAMGLLGMALADPVEELWLVAFWAVVTAFGSATQDISIDAYRVEAVGRERQGAMAATYVTGYRLAILMAGAGALHIAAVGSWSVAYGVMALLMGVGLVTTLIVREPEVQQVSDDTRRMEQRVVEYLDRTTHQGALRDFVAWFLSAVVCPFADFFKRYGLAAVAVLLFVGTFRISDIVMGVMANPFYLDLGFTKTEIANVAAAFGLGMTLGGAALGGVLVLRFGIARMLIFTAIMAPLTNLTFSWLALIGPELYGLVFAIIADNVTGGMAISVFLAYLASLTNTAYTATQYALFSSLMTLPGQFLGGFTGWLAEQVDWVWFFIIAAGAGLPAIVLGLVLLRVAHPDRMRQPGKDD